MDYTIIKIGYSSGIYGCSNEYFVCIYTTNKGLDSFHFSGMYGAKERVSSKFQDKGYNQTYVPSVYGRVTRNDIPSKAFMGEQEAVDFVQTLRKLPTK